MYRKINEETVAFQAGNTARMHFVRDHLGSVRAVVDDAGTVLETVSFNVYDFGARLYDPALGRWLSQDPLAEKYQAHSPYLFCAGNPMRFVDPEGKVIAVREFLEGNVMMEYHWQENDGEWGFYDSDNNLYSGSDQYILSVTNALLQLMEGTTGSNMVAEIAGNDETVLIENNQTKKAPTGYYVSSKRVAWSESESNSYPFISLGHELAHALDDLRGTMNSEIWIPKVPTKGGIYQDIPYIELFSTHVENLIRKEHGYPLRSSYLEGDVHSYIVWSLIIDTAGSSLYFNPQGTTSYNMLPPSNRYKY